MRPAVILCLAMFAFATPLAAQVAVGSGTVVAVGTGEVVLKPDHADISITIRTIAPEPDEAQSLNETTATAVAAVLAGLDLDSDSIRLTTLRIGPHIEYSPAGVRRPAGYAATRSLSVATDDLGMVSRIVDVATRAGATSIDRVSYSSSRADDARLEALTEAVGNARAEAEVMAAAADGRLGGLALLTTNPAGSRPVQTRGFGVRTIQTALVATDPMPDPSDLTITAVVEGHWTFIPNG
ncbi:MAG: SIMPL domain-containing protein [Gemmatimonadota bacterium]